MYVMSIGGNCADLAFLGPGTRVPGPVDNWYAINGMKSIIGLFTSFEDQLTKGWTRKERGWYYYKDYACPHLNVENPVVIEKILKRYATFLRFWSTVRSEPRFYFSYVLNPADVCKNGDKNVLTESTVDMLKNVDKYFPLHKLIVVGTPLIDLKDGWFNNYIDDPPPGINYVNIKDIKNSSIRYGNDIDKEWPRKQFNQYIETLKV